jgi:hypothetical protein
MTVEMIYTFRDKPQQIATYPFVLPILKNRRTFTEFALAPLSRQEKEQLVKISSCICLNGSGEVAFPLWFSQCNGKLWFENGIPV